MIIDEQDYLSHYGTPRHSGRYPWGSGGNEGLPRNASFLDHVAEMKKQGLSEAQIAEGMGISTTQLRAKKSMARNEEKQAKITQALALKEKGMSNVAAAKQMGIAESSYRALIEPGAKDRADNLTQVADMLKRQVDTHTWVDVGSGVERHVGNIGVSKEKLAVAVEILKQQGYMTHEVPLPQGGTAFETRMKVLGPPGSTQKEAWENRSNIKQITEFSPDGGRTYGKIHDPISVHPNRVTIRYKEDGGGEADGVIFVRPGVKDVNLGKARYAQVRVLVGEGHYLKGMAMYKDDLPPGTDLLFNTNKSSTGNKLDALKPITDNKDYPFGSVVRQITADPGTPNEHVTSAMNIVTEEGQWGKWSKTLSSQFLSKQPHKLAQAQLNTTVSKRKKDLEEIKKLTNPTVRKKLLEDFADDADSSAVHLKAATLPRSAWHAILPISSMKPTEIHAPNYEDGTKVALIRYPHGGTFEIPDLIVNNKNREARRLLGDAQDAVGIHHSVAHRLSGADFDGDTVLVIPNNSRKVISSPALEGLKGFDPIHEYPGYEGMPKINKQAEMGKISNLITDMTLRGAPHKDIARAIRHSMVVIDAEKHELNWKESERRNGIAALKVEYQGGPRAGASTLISKKKQTESIPHRKLRLQSQGGAIDPTTGRKVFVETGRTRKNKEGERVLVTERVKKLALTDDAHTLVSGTPTLMEKLYADHSNKLKALANEARLEAINTPRLQRSSSAAKVYTKEVSSLNAKLALVQAARPRERQAQVIFNAAVKAKFEANPNLEKESKKKIKFAELEKARARMGVKNTKIEITTDEWNAIQAGAISHNILDQILKKADMDKVRKLATPKPILTMTPALTQRAKTLLKNHTRAEVAAQLGVSLSTLDRATIEQAG